MLNTLDYQIMQSKLQQASFGAVLYNKQQALNYYINQINENKIDILMIDEDLKEFLGEKHIGELKVIEHYVFGVAMYPEV